MSAVNEIPLKSPSAKVLASILESVRDKAFAVNEIPPKSPSPFIPSILESVRDKVSAVNEIPPKSPSPKVLTSILESVRDKVSAVNEIPPKSPSPKVLTSILESVRDKVSAVNEIPSTPSTTPDESMLLPSSTIAPAASSKMSAPAPLEETEIRSPAVRLPWVAVRVIAPLSVLLISSTKVAEVPSTPVRVII